MRSRNLIESRRGSMAFEMAIVLPFLLTMIYGIIEVGRLLYTVAALNYAVERAARCAVIDMVACGGTAPSTPQCYAASWALGLGLHCGDISSAACTITGSSAGGTQVSIDYSFHSALSYLVPGGRYVTIPLHAQSCFPA